MPTVPKTKGNEAALAKQLIAGTQKRLANMPQLLFAGSSFTPAQVEAQLETLATLRAGVDDARSTLKAKLAAQRAQAPALVSFMQAFEAFVRAMFGNQPDVLADFGLAPKKARKPLTTEERAAADAKRNATRKARGTTGKRTKRLIKGDVTGVDITPVTASANPAPAAPSAPAAPTPGSGTK